MIISVVPQYRRFKLVCGSEFDGRNTSFNSNVYNGNGYMITVNDDGSIVSDPIGVLSSLPLLRWDANAEVIYTMTCS